MITILPHTPSSTLVKQARPPVAAATRPRRYRPRPTRHRVVRLVGYVVAFLLPPLVAALWSLSAAAPPSIAGPLDSAPPAPPVHDDRKQTAVVVTGVNGAESIDTLVPYQLLAESGRFNVYTVAPRRAVVPLFPASPQLQGVELLPHLSLEDYDEQVGVAPDVIVVPWVPAHDGNAPLLAWLREQATADTTLLTICGGSWTAAQAGLLDGRPATSHANVLPLLRRDHPEVDWIDGRRWVEDGNVVSSAGITAAFDATLRVLEQRLGREAADEVAARVGYPHARFLDDPAYAVPPTDRTAHKLAVAYGWGREAVGVALYDGVDEIALASIVDVYPRTHRVVIDPIAPTDVVTSRHGLHLVPRLQPEAAPQLDRLLVPGTPGSTAAADLASWAQATAVPVRFVHDGEDFAVDAALRDLADTQTLAVATNVARGIEYPIDEQTLPWPAWPYALALRPLGLGLLGLLAAAAVTRRGRPAGRPA